MRKLCTGLVVIALLSPAWARCADCPECVTDAERAPDALETVEEAQAGAMSCHDHAQADNHAEPAAEMLAGSAGSCSHCDMSCGSIETPSQNVPAYLKSYVSEHILIQAQPHDSETATVAFARASGETNSDVTTGRNLSSGDSQTLFKLRSLLLI